MPSSTGGVFFYVFAIYSILVTATTTALLELPNTSGIDGQLTANLGVDHFFSLWIVFNNDDVKMSGEPFTILAPQNSATKRAENVLQQPELVKKLVLDHVLLGSRIDLTNVTTDTSFKTLGGRTVHVQRIKNGKLKANEANVVERKVAIPNGLLVVLDNYLFPDEQQPQQIVLNDKKNTTATTTQGKLINIGALSSSSSSSLSAAAISSSTTAIKENDNINKNQSNTTFVENIMEVLSFLKSSVRVFHHFLSRSNVSKLLNNGDEYTVFVPTDHAFQRWHPIDWGFYPFSVPEFTESIIINHFVQGRLKQDTIKDGQIVKTIGGREIIFKKTPSLSVNGAMIVKGDTPVSKGNIMFIGEVLFVSESVVSKLHQQHRDKETPPLLAFPWFGAQFLSHAFLALERDKRFTHITRFLNLADLAPHVSGTGYTFFVPTDAAFEELGLNKMPDNYLSTGDGLQILLNHFVKGRLYDRELIDGMDLMSLGNKSVNVKRTKETIKVNDATIVESEVFVYNLGTMFYIDKVLFANINNLPVTSTEMITKVEMTTNSFLSTLSTTTIPSEIESLSGKVIKEIPLPPSPDHFSVADNTSTTVKSPSPPDGNSTTSSTKNAAIK